MAKSVKVIKKSEQKVKQQADLLKSETGLSKVNKDLEQKQGIWGRGVWGRGVWGMGCMGMGCMGMGCMGQVYYCYSMSLQGCSAQCVQVSNLGKNIRRLKH